MKKIILVNCKSKFQSDGVRLEVTFAEESSGKIGRMYRRQGAEMP